MQLLKDGTYNVIDCRDNMLGVSMSDLRITVNTSSFQFKFIPFELFSGIINEHGNIVFNGSNFRNIELFYCRRNLK